MRNGPPTISPVTVNVPITVAFPLAVRLPVERVLTPVMLPLVMVISPDNPLTTIPVPTVKVPLENVNALLSCSLPLVPANVTRPLVKSLTSACANVDKLDTPNVPVTFELASNSIVPVPTVLSSKLLFELVVSIRLPTI